MIKFFYKLFKKQIKKIQFYEQAQKADLHKLEKCFTDSNGKNYFKYLDDMEIPLMRKGMIELKLMEMKCGLTFTRIDNGQAQVKGKGTEFIADYQSELDFICLAMKKAINNGNKPDIAMVGHLIHEIEDRKKILIHPEIIFDIVALTYIREDEDPTVIDGEIHNQKLEQFKKDSKELYNFFFGSGIGKYLPYLDLLKDDWNQYMREAKAKVEALQEQIRTYISNQELSTSLTDKSENSPT